MELITWTYLKSMQSSQHTFQSWLNGTIKPKPGLGLPRNTPVNPRPFQVSAESMTGKNKKVIWSALQTLTGRPQVSSVTV